MIVKVKNKFISLRGSSFTEDEQGNPVCKIKGKLITVTRKKFVQDLDGHTLFIVRCRWLNFFFHKAYVCDARGKRLLSIRNKFALKNTYKMESYGADVFDMDGDWFSFNMTVARNGKQIGRLHRDFNLIRDTFVVEGDYENIPFLVALIIAIDNVCDDATNDMN